MAAQEIIILLIITPACENTITKVKVLSDVASAENAIVPRRPQAVSMRYAPMKLPGNPLTEYFIQDLCVYINRNLHV